ncbi:MAG: ribonuclease H-like domain-containing protein [Thermoplasmata archaeon]|nr:ribonuclease H-like domain-containing protein [Thermoplasmata archaeon]
MLEESLKILSVISEKKEKWLKKNNVKNWDDILKSGENFFNKDELKKLKREIKHAKKHLNKKDLEFFKKKLDPKDYYILYQDFKDKTCFLDIETTGLGDMNEITIVGIADFLGRYRVYVNGINLNEKNLIKFLKNFSIVVTFYGSRFDLPFIKKKFPHLEKIFDKMVHIDLCFLGHRVGFKGGLKFIEKQVGIERENQIAGLTGYDAVKLWNRYKYGDINSLITLVRYNRSDVLNLIKLIDIEIKMMNDFYS